MGYRRFCLICVLVNGIEQGRYLPLFASAVYDQNARLIAAGITPINLQSVIIGA